MACSDSRRHSRNMQWPDAVSHAERYFGGRIAWVKTAELTDGIVTGTAEHVTEKL